MNNTSVESIQYGDMLEIEDALQEAGVFENGLNGRPQHMDAYLTVIDYKKLAAAFAEMKDRYSREQWEKIADNWASHAYLSPNQAQLAFFVNRQFGFKSNPN